MNRLRGSRSARLLLVEDSAADLRYAREVFKEGKLRNHLHHVHDAEAALEYLTGVAPLPDLVLLDMHLPGMDGAALVAALRGHARLGSLPIVALAPSEMHADQLRRQGLDAHCCLLKPLSVPSLLEMATRIDSLGVELVTGDGEEEAA